MIASGELGARDPLDAFLVHRFRLDAIDSLWRDDRGSLNGPFFLKHPDDKGDHILVNESFDIVGVIDWEWTCTVPKAEAFSSPCMMWPVNEFYNGSNELAVDELRLADIYRERGRQDLANCVLEGRRVQRFLFAVGPECDASDKKTLVNLFLGLRCAIGVQDEDWELWKSSALKKWEGDKQLRALLKAGRIEEQN